MSARFISATIYNVRWDGLLGQLDFVVYVFNFQGYENQIILDCDGKIAVTRDHHSFAELKRICRDGFVHFPDPLELGEEQIEIYVRDAIETIVSEDCDAQARLYHLLVMIDDLLICLDRDHHGRSYESSSTISELRRMRMFVWNNGGLYGFFSNPEEKPNFLANFHELLKYLIGEMRVVISSDH